MKRLLWLLAGLALLNGALLWPWTPEASGHGATGLRVGVVFDVGGRGDKSFNDLAYAGLIRARNELGVAVEYIEPGDGADRESALRIFASRGFDLVIGTGFIFSDDLERVAAQYPRVWFAGVDYAVRLDARGRPIAPPADMKLTHQLAPASEASQSGVAYFGTVPLDPPRGSVRPLS